ncbi:MAG TPA: glycosyltransferase family 87 protein [Dehalococcoidia bacterium]|nr:glycosyltransferase family 87 protein [Dehalococcoidia bacterium]
MRLPGLRQHWPRILFAAAVLWHIFMMSSLWTGHMDPLFHDSDTAPQAIDFYAIYQAGDWLIDGRSIYVVDFFFLDVPIAPPPFRYMPFVAYALAVPLNALPPETAYWVWEALVECMLLGCAWLTFRVGRDHAPWNWASASLWLVPTPLYTEMYLGQFSILMATLLLLTLILLLRGRAWASAVPWTVSLMVKANTALLAPLLLRMGHWRVIAAALVAVAILNVPYVLINPGEFEHFWRHNFSEYFGERSRSDAFSTADLGFMQLVRTMWLWWVPDATHAPSWLLFGIGAAVLGASLAATFRPRDIDVTLLAPMWISVYFLVYTDVWSHHYVMLLPALVLLIIYQPEFRLMALIVFVAVALPTPYFLFDRFLNSIPGERVFGVAIENYWPRWAGLAHHATKPVPVLWLWGSLVYYLIVTPSPSAAAEPDAERALATGPAIEA